jgi:hypothetical protein
VSHLRIVEDPAAADAGTATISGGRPEASHSASSRPPSASTTGR